MARILDLNFIDLEGTVVAFDPTIRLYSDSISMIPLELTTQTIDRIVSFVLLDQMVISCG